MSKQIIEIFKRSKEKRNIENSLYKKFEVKNGLRNEDNTGVLVGLTKVSDVVGYKIENGKKVAIEGKLYYRGIDIEQIIKESKSSNLYEEVCFLILFGYLPNKNELKLFTSELQEEYELPKDLLESKILRFPSESLMNKLQQDVLTLYSYDEKKEDTTVEHKLSQGISIIAKMPSLMCYNYQSKMSYFHNKSLTINKIDKNLSIAENILRMIRSDLKYTKKEVEVLDITLALHADHGGGNNSTFVNVVISSTGTDLYSSFAGAIGSLKGPKHGGANLKVCAMMKEVIDEIGYTKNLKEIKKIINKIIQKEFYDKSGLIYGMGHAVYTISDPRSKILKQYAKQLAEEKNKVKEFTFYENFEKIASAVIFEKKGIQTSSNVDFYSGFIYQLLNISEELYTMLFVCARTVGWLAHNIESQLYSAKIVRPATKFVGELQEFQKLEKRGK